MQDNRGGVITINGGNMAEYFMKKSQQFTSTIKKEQEEIESESELTKYVGFGFSSQVQRETKSVEEEEDAKGVGKKVETKKSQRHKEDSPSNYAFENPCIQLDSPEIVSNSSKCKSYKRKSLDDIKPSPSKKVKKFKSDESVSESEYGIVNAAMDLDVDNEPVNETFNGKEFEVPRVQFGLTNTGLDLSDETNVKKRRVTFNDHVEYSTDPINKKKKLITLDKFEVENTKRKKKKSKDKKKDHHVVNDNSISSGFVNEALELVEPTEVNDNEMVNKKKKKSKDKKKPKPDDDYTSSGFVNEALDLASLEKSVEVNDNEINEISEVRCDNVRKKRSRRSNLETIIEIPEEDGLDVTKRSKVEDDITEIDNSVVAVDSNQLQDDGAKKKDKKKKCKGNIEEEHKKVTTIEEKKIILESGNVRLEEEDEQSINEEKRIMDILQEKKMRKNKSSDQLEEEVQNDTEAVKLKKKKKKENQDKSIDQNSEINPETDGNKENDVHEEFTETELKKKKKKKKKDKDENNLNVSKTNDLNKLEEGTEIKKGTPNKESRKENSSKETELTIEPKENSSEIQYSQDNNIDATQNTEFRNNKNRRFSSSNRRSSTRNNSNNDNSSSPRNQRSRMSKKLLVSLFNKSSVHNFPGSNMDEIKGYGVQ
ncbi:uncharacterized protein DDB_G0283697-like [Ceratina calcarata]|uniref:Uncharacterized protein DDB_G0283697-like n=1 Tax=Ceratina calcarata TaxID=156304 RepID=A0AAJ7IWE8_9HYME|nr:uncharacterized protein DDB_G0283697-like [Ceratina calcarata]